jgi:hypothetical protein
VEATSPVLIDKVGREGIELPGGFTATVNVVMQVGALEETVTVTGANPLVDTVNTRTQAVVSDELLSALPSGTQGLGTLINITPGMSGVADVGGSVGAYRAMGTPQSVMYHGRTGMKVLRRHGDPQHGRQRQRQLHHQLSDDVCGLADVAPQKFGRA